MPWTLPTDFIDRIQWQDVADILLISFLAHRLILVFRGTSALGAMAALVGLRLIQEGAREAGLVLTTWLLEGLGTILVILIVVVFRNEIRDALILTNPIRLVWGRPKQSRPTELRNMAETAFDLAETRTGALLIFRDRDSLLEHLRGGVRLNGYFSGEMLRSIFSKGSPVHDGAVVLRGNRIERVGVFLPLTRRPGLPQQFGTRHQAAIGLSEVSDATVVVVSEERGEVSLVHRGNVELAGDAAELERGLRRLLFGEEGGERGSGWRRELLTQAASFVATALVVGIFWGISTERQPSLTSITTRIDYRNVPAGLEMQNIKDESVAVQVAGRSLIVSSLKPEQVVAFVDLQGARPGKGQRVRMGPRNFEIPPGLEVVQVEPTEITFDLESRLEVERKIEPRIKGPVPAGFRREVVARPESVRIVGPESAIRNSAVNSQVVGALELGPDHPEKVVEVGIELVPPSVRLVPGQPDRVRLTIRLLPESAPPSPPNETTEPPKVEPNSPSN